MPINPIFYINPIWQWLWKYGWEEPVGPLGPLAQQLNSQPELSRAAARTPAPAVACGRASAHRGGPGEGPRTET